MVYNRHYLAENLYLFRAKLRLLLQLMQTFLIKIFSIKFQMLFPRTCFYLWTAYCSDSFLYSSRPSFSSFPFNKRHSRFWLSRTWSGAFNPATFCQDRSIPDRMSTPWKILQMTQARWAWTWERFQIWFHSRWNCSVAVSSSFLALFGEHQEFILFFGSAWSSGEIIVGQIWEPRTP